MTRRLSALVRTSLLVLLALGVVIKPLLGFACEIHALGDAVTIAVAGQLQDPAGDQHQSDRDHARGAHQRLHEGSFGGAYADIVGVIILPTGPFGSSPPPPMVAVPVASQPLAGPFRPPIA